MDEGHMYIGNISVESTTRWFMEYATDWFVFHRTRDDMRRLAEKLLPRPRALRVEAERLGINLFLVARK